jgi:hypothetical protein
MDTDSGQPPTIPIKEAAYRCGKSRDTIARWAKIYGIGRQLHPHAPWLIDPVGLQIVASGDPEALDAYQRNSTPLARTLQSGRAA